jgi:two-component system phosphate regulon response regulator OmpR
VPDDGADFALISARPGHLLERISGKQQLGDGMADANQIAASQIAVVDDEPEIRAMLADYLGHAGFEVSTAEGGAALRALLEERTIELVILDINMPGEDGLSLARFLRAEQPAVAIVMLTAAGEVVDRVVGLEMGADDYIPKPVDLRELLARIRAVLRRAQAHSPEVQAERSTSQREVRFGDCRLDLNAHRLFAADGREIPLTSMEFDLLKAFADHPNQVLSRDRLLDLAHNKDWEPFDRSIDIRVTRLRRKIEEDAAKPQVIKTVRGAGYIFVPAGR